MRPTFLIFVLLTSLLPFRAFADDRLVHLYAPEILIDSGLLKHIAPRFTLKTQVRIDLVDDADQADLVIGNEGRALFDGLGQTWRMALRSADHPGTKRFAEWLTGPVGRKTILAYAPEGTPLFTEPTAQARVVADVEISGDAALGRRVSQEKCIRCHTVDDNSKMSSIGSTPSFHVLRSLPDWEGRFAAFYALNPHPAFTQVTDVTEPFHESRPSPIAPITLTLKEVEAILSYVAGMQPADLGAPLASQ